MPLSAEEQAMLDDLTSGGIESISHTSENHPNNVGTTLSGNPFIVPTNKPQGSLFTPPKKDNTMMLILAAIVGFIIWKIL